MTDNGDVSEQISVSTKAEDDAYKIYLSGYPAYLASEDMYFNVPESKDIQPHDSIREVKKGTAKIIKFIN